MENTYQLIQSCIKGNRTSQKALYNHYSDRMYGICLRITKCKEEAEDCLQIGFVKVFTRLDTLKDENSFEGWMKRIFTNVCFNQISKIKYNESLSSDMIHHIDYSLDGYHNLIIKEMETERQKLPAGYRDVITLYADGYSHSEIGKILGIKESSSRSQYLRGKQLFKNRLQMI